MINCVTFYWNDGHDCPFSADYVNRLFNSVDRNMTAPHRNICFTDLPDGIREGIEIRPLVTRDWLRNLKKLVQFDPANGFEGRVLSFDLDNVIVGSLDLFARYSGQFAVCGEVSPSRKGKPGGNFLGFPAGFGAKSIWQKVFDNYSYYKKETNGFERYLFDLLINRKKMGFWNDMYPGSIASYKVHIRKGAMTDFSNLRMVWCHGKPNPHEIQDGWIRKHWR